MPGSALVELAVRAGDEVGCGVVEELLIEAPLVVPGAGAGCGVQVTVEAPGRGRAAARWPSTPRGGRRRRDRWRCVDPARHRAASPVRRPRPAPSTSPPGPRPGAWAEVTCPARTSGCSGTATSTGPVFQGLRALWRRGDELFAEVALPGRTAGRGGPVRPPPPPCWTPPCTPRCWTSRRPTARRSGSRWSGTG
ncbi:polyketide synthase dehydratase domain-containing protein [Streptomyces tricolor]|nr:polyketide synthase dehydratase domain-containing protein [Streptomyces tricolor]